MKTVVDVERSRRSDMIFFADVGRLFGKQGRKWWVEERGEVEGGVITHRDMLTMSRSASRAAGFIYFLGREGGMRNNN